jgi:hypothetical protein
MFTLGLKKFADNAASGGTNNQGLQFGGADETPYGAGAALFAPSGIPTYQPTGGPMEETSKKKNRITGAVLSAISMSKNADASFMLDQGNMSNQAPTVATQLKWDTDTAPKTQDVGLGLDKSGPKYKRKKSMSFVKSMLKEAGIGPAAKRVAHEAWEGAKSFGKGLHSTGSHTLGDTLSLKSLKHLSAAAESGASVKTREGRMRLSEALGKSAPSLAVGGAYAYGAKKLYDKTLGSTPSYTDANYGGY